ncbi:winged helix-turn-helix domain-containing protein [Amycolatopsis sp. GM8]|uniref:winged helix-turn-helix domain-containing protein n=1 Tax=Amycolatopsis sp. GM8 TaxID=2896530 RepID=UPI001F196046|nr:winged helix-turn-helix domain-containing protein [Amycolatopsis sp. GM8]
MATESNRELDDAPGYIYDKVADSLMARIAAGELSPHDKLPSERHLAKDYGVAQGTMRQAIRVLRERELIVTLRAKGNYVAPAALAIACRPHR